MLNEAALKRLIIQQPELFEILQITATLNLADSWLCAGSLRNFIWNKLAGRPPFDQQSDVDIIFFDRTISYEKTVQLNRQLRQAQPKYNWELKNQAFMHHHNPHTAPYHSSRDAIRHFPERCTAIGARLNPRTQQLELFLPYGLADITRFVIAPTPYFANDPEKIAVFKQRVAKKTWQQQWPQLQIVLPQ
ncbi:nucleotidyltransferase family protein [Lapidilactobacillus wuchangensis]|uniref:nucleotidyltransferase family protein n=1 Tax=Lapidilactobacillus wuchangensis TaxID=2486001 RepID=UPI000F78B6F8|nr:nucleotidyltransferase family protein [Lapidilactobacillus wuchangensis]